MNIPSDFNPEKRAIMAEEFFRQGYNCSQSVALAFADIIGLPPDTIAGITSGFGGGMGRLREVCGAFSACVFLTGVLSPSTDPKDQERKKKSYALVQEFAARFKEENGGSIICRELLGLTDSGQESPAPSPRDAVYYKKRPCAEIVRSAALIVAEKIQNYSE